MLAGRGAHGCCLDERREQVKCSPTYSGGMPHLAEERGEEAEVPGERLAADEPDERTVEEISGLEVGGPHRTFRLEGWEDALNRVAGLTGEAKQGKLLLTLWRQAHDTSGFGDFFAVIGEFTEGIHRAAAPRSGFRMFNHFQEDRRWNYGHFVVQPDGRGCVVFNRAKGGRVGVHSRALNSESFQDRLEKLYFNSSDQIYFEGKSWVSRKEGAVAEITGLACGAQHVYKSLSQSKTLDDYEGCDIYKDYCLVIKRSEDCKSWSYGSPRPNGPLIPIPVQFDATARSLVTIDKGRIMGAGEFQNPWGRNRNFPVYFYSPTIVVAKG